jgi:hypothetical protein
MIAVTGRTETDMTEIVMIGCHIVVITEGMIGINLVKIIAEMKCVEMVTDLMEGVDNKGFNLFFFYADTLSITEQPC